MTQIIERGGTQNIESNEPLTKNNISFVDYSKDAEKVNGRWAMLGLGALIGAYSNTGQIIPGIF